MPTLCSNCAKFFWPEIMRDGRITHLGQRLSARLPVCVPSLGDVNSKRRASSRSSARDEVLQNVHCLYWLDNVPDILLHHCIAATLAEDDDELRSVALRVQRGLDDPRAPLRHEPVEYTWCATTQKWAINLPHHWTVVHFPTASLYRAAAPPFAMLSGCAVVARPRRTSATCCRVRNQVR